MPSDTRSGRIATPASTRARASRSSTSRVIRSDSSIASRSAAVRSSGARFGSRATSSRLPRMIVSGVRSSCEASSTNLRCSSRVRDRAVWAPCNRSSMVLNASPSLPSSSARPDGTRSLKSPVSPMRTAVAPMSSTGRSAVRAVRHPSAAARAIPASPASSSRLRSRDKVSSTSCNEAAIITVPTGSPNWSNSVCERTRKAMPFTDMSRVKARCPPCAISTTRVSTGSRSWPSASERATTSPFGPTTWM